MKKDSIDDKIGTINSFAEDGLWDLNKYIQELIEQFKLESKLLFFADKDPTLNDEQRKTLKDRVTERKNLIGKEINQVNQEEEGQEKSKKEEPKKEASKKEIIETKKSLNPVFTVPKDKESEEIKRLNDIKLFDKKIIDANTKNNFDKNKLNNIKIKKENNEMNNNEKIKITNETNVNQKLDTIKNVKMKLR